MTIIIETTQSNMRVPESILSLNVWCSLCHNHHSYPKIGTCIR